MPQVTTTSYAPVCTAWAANVAACWLDPHWRLIVVAGTLSGKPASSAVGALLGSEF